MSARNSTRKTKSLYIRRTFTPAQLVKLQRKKHGKAKGENRKRLRSNKKESMTFGNATMETHMHFAGLRAKEKKEEDENDAMEKVYREARRKYEQEEKVWKKIFGNRDHFFVNLCDC